MEKKGNILLYIILFLFYFALGYLFLGRQSNLASIRFIIIPSIIFLILSMVGTTSLLYSDFIRQDNYSRNYVVLNVFITQIILISAFILYVSLYGNNFEITPLTGYIVMGASLLTNIFFLRKDLSESWVRIALSIHIFIFAIFIFWNYIGISIILLGALYMIIHNIFVVSYGLLRWQSNHKL